MPSGIHPVPRFRPNPGQKSGGRPKLALRIRTRLRRNGLDGELARGADAAGDPALGLRARQLSSTAERTRLAGALVEVMGEAARSEPVGIRSRPQRIEVLKQAEELQALIDRLRGERRVEARGMAMTARLLSDRASPLRRAGQGDLRHAIRAARLALDARDSRAQGLARAA